MFNTKIIRLTKLAEKAGVPYFTVYRRHSGGTKRELPTNVRTKLFNALWKDVKDIADYLGFTVTATRKDD